MAEIRERRPLRFGSFEPDPRSGELRKAGVLVGLQDQSLKVLLASLERPDMAISPDGRWLLYTQMDHRSGDLMLVENFVGSP